MLYYIVWNFVFKDLYEPCIPRQPTFTLHFTIPSSNIFETFQLFFRQTIVDLLLYISVDPADEKRFDTRSSYSNAMGKVCHEGNDCF